MECIFKVLIIGDSGVGKSSILLRYVDDKFRDSFVSTIGIDFRVKKIVHKDMNIKLQIWDTSGQERFTSISKIYYRTVHGVFAVFDLTNGDSFLHLNKWINEVKINSHDDIPIIILGNKKDKADIRIVSFNEAEDYANRLHTEYYETSSKDDDNIAEVFDGMVKKILDYVEEHKDVRVNKKVIVSQVKESERAPNEVKNDGCCN
jgi:small GTP-binding protein